MISDCISQISDWGAGRKIIKTKHYGTADMEFVPIWAGC